MQIPNPSPLHLTYCLNIHPGETWSEHLRSIQNEATAVRCLVQPRGPFGLGLRLGCAAAQELRRAENLESFRQYLADAGLYVFTINGFPYGQFHGRRVKEDVYRPDWRTVLRADYTLALAESLAALLPDGMDGSISTVPLGYKAHWTESGAETAAIRQLVETTASLYRLQAATGRTVHLGLEPEPDCQLETTAETIAFFQRLWREGSRRLRGHVPAGEEEAVLRRHLGVCFDTCHVALQFEDPAEMLRRYQAEAIRISKIQISAALEVDPRRPDAIRDFDEPVYLHQAKVLTPHGTVESWPDLPPLLMTWPGEARRIRVHFHVPLVWSGTEAIRPTTDSLGPAFWQAVKAGASQHLEVETYSFYMMPEAVRPPDVVRSLQLELQWVCEKLGMRASQLPGS
jgi:sugar phosphate isomerase/epimerase